MSRSKRSTPWLMLVCSSWFVSSVFAVFLVKALFTGRVPGVAPFPFPLTIAITSNVVSIFLARYFSSDSDSTTSRPQQRDAMLIGILTAGEVGFSNFALNQLTLGLATMMKGMAPLIVMCWSVLLGVHKPNVRLGILTLTICVGLGLAVIGQKDLQGTRYALVDGVGAQFLSGVVSGLRWIMTQVFVQGSNSMEAKSSYLSFISVDTQERPVSPMAVIRTTAPYTAASMAPFFLFYEGRYLVYWLSTSTGGPQLSGR